MSGKRKSKYWLDYLIAGFVYLSARLLRYIKKKGIGRFPVCKNILLNAGVFPITNHYNEPLFDYRGKEQFFGRERHLPGIDWNYAKQVDFLKELKYANELSTNPTTQQPKGTFHINNGSFASGDAEFWYQIVRSLKPKRIFEIGSGNSTLVARLAIEKNRQLDASYQCNHVCIEPYETPWLESTGVTVLREPVEDVDTKLFSELANGDVLFIDSSHMIRPVGDVLTEYLEILPMLQKGVLVHVHDIFTPRNYPFSWFNESVKFWNEQFLLEAFLSHNHDWQIVAAVNWLKNNHFEALRRVCPFLTPEREPGSFYLQKIN